MFRSKGRRRWGLNMAVKSGSLKSTKSDKSDKSDGGSKSGKEPLSLLKESNVFCKEVHANFEHGQLRADDIFFILQ